MDEMMIDSKKRELRQLLEKAQMIAAGISGSDYVRPSEQRKFREMLNTLEMLERMVW